MTHFRTTLPIALFACLATSCAITKSGPAEPANSTESMVASTETTPPQDPVESAVQSKRLPAADRAILQSPLFRRRFVESYVAETDVEPTMNEDEREAMMQAFEFIAAEKLDEAEAIVRGWQTPKASAVFDFTLGNLLYQRDDVDGAIAAYERAVEKHPKFRRAWGNIAQLYYANGDFASAKRALSRVLQTGGGDAVTYALLGVCHSRGEDHLAAESAFRRAIMLEPDALDYRMALAENLFRQGQFGAAASLFDYLIQIQPDKPELWRFQGEAYAMLGRPMDAAQNFEMVAELGGATPATLNNLGDIYANEKLFDLAADAYLRALEHDPLAPIERAMRAADFMSANSALAEMRKLLDGVDRLCQADLDLASRKQLLRLRAKLAAGEGSDEDHHAELRKIIALDPLDGDALIKLGRHLGRNEKPEEAIAYFEQAANVDGHEAEALLRHGELLVKLARYEEGLRLLKRSQDLRPREFVRKYIEDVERVSRGAR